MRRNEPFRVDVEALMEVLEKHLYSSTRVALRELIANARDAILRRERRGDTFDPRIDLRVDPVADALSVRDNGHGMDAQEIEDGLATIAGSYTRLLRGIDGSEPWSDDTALSGYFGLGVYASLMLSRAVVVTTKTEPGDGALRWTCQGRPLTWSLETVKEPWPGPGTDVTLYLLAEHRSTLGPPQVLAREVAHYAGLVEVPILVEGHAGCVNPPPPWRAEWAGEADYEDFLRRRGLLQEDESPLTLVPLEGEPGIEGVLWIGRRDDESPKVELHVRHLRVGLLDDCIGDGLPLAHGVVNCGFVPVTLSREDVIRGEPFDRMRKQLKAALMSHLRELSERKPRTFHEIIATHGPLLKRDALEDEATLEAVSAGLTVPTGVGGRPMSLQRLAELAGEGQTLYYMDEPETQIAYSSLTEARGMPVVSAQNPLDRALLHRFAEQRGLDCQRVDVDAEVGEGLDDREESDWAEVEQLFASLEQEAQIRIARMGTNDPPLLFVHTERDQMAEFLPQAERAAEAGEIDAGLVEALKFMTGLELRRPLVLNISHPAMLALRSAIESAVSPTDLKLVGRALLGAARLYTERLTPAERLHALECLVNASRRLLEELGGTDND